MDYYIAWKRDGRIVRLLQEVYTKQGVRRYYWTDRWEWAKAYRRLPAARQMCAWCGEGHVVVDAQMREVI